MTRSREDGSMQALDYRRFDRAAHGDALLRILNLAFGGEPDDTRQWLDACGDAPLRVVVEGDHVRAGLALYEMGHWFGGRSVPCRGVAGVGVAPDARGRGVGTHLMIAAVRELHDAGIALSTLYPAVQPIYRRAGYERAGQLCVVDTRLREIAPRERNLPVRTATSADDEVLVALESAQATLHDGNVDRGALMRERARTPRGKPTEAVVVEEDGRPTGFLRYRLLDVDHKLWLSCPDVVATTPGAARRLLAFLADHAAQVKKARWLGHPTQAVVAAAESGCIHMKSSHVWMARITHLEAAIAARGYTAEVRGEVHVDVTDDLCPGNAGRWTIRVEGGRGEAVRGGRGDVRLHVRELASIYTGYVHPRQLRAARPIDGDDAQLATLGALFAGGSPWMQDAF